RLEPEGDVLRGMRGDLQHACLVAAEGDCLPLVEPDVDAGNARRILGRADYLDAEGLLKLEIAADMGPLMVRAEDVGQLAISAYHRALDGGGLRSINDTANVFAAVVDEVGIIVLETWYGIDLECAHGGQI